MDKTLTYLHNFNIWNLRYKVYSDLPEVAKHFKRAYALFSDHSIKGIKKQDIIIKISARNKKDKEVEDLLSDAQRDIYHSWMKYFSDRVVFFHASSVELKNHYVLFMGGSRSGKSTMAAMMRDRGFRVLNDDFSPVDYKTKRVVSFPLFSNIRRGRLSNLQKEYSHLLREYFSRFDMLRRDYLFYMSDEEFEAYYSYNKRLYKLNGGFKGSSKPKKRFIAVFLSRDHGSIKPKLSKIDFPDSFNMYINSMHMPLKVFNKSLKVIIDLFGDFECYSLSRASARKSAKLILSRFS